MGQMKRWSCGRIRPANPQSAASDERLKANCETYDPGRAWTVQDAAARREAAGWAGRKSSLWQYRRSEAMPLL